MGLTLDEIDGDGVVHITTDGDITALDVESNNPLEDAVGHKWAANRVVLDMGGVSYVDSMAIGWLINCQKQFENHGGQLVLHSVQPGVRQMFDTLKLGSLFPIADDKATARRQAVAAKGGQA